MKRGDVVLVRFPHPSGIRGKKRPAVVVQSDDYAGQLKTLIVAQVTKNLTLASDPA
jgi:mRNA-degrading endonuclease toxin of MazEF toxin-antitoxin module